MSPLSLIIKSLLGLIFLLVVMSAALFWPYGGFDYSLAWWYLGMFTLCVVVITAYLFFYDKNLLSSRLAVWPIAETRREQKIIQSIAGLMFIAVFVVSAFDAKNAWSHVPSGFSYLANILSVLAFVMIFFVFRQNTFLSATIEVQKTQHVVTTGLYGIVRHPMYTGASALLIFTPIALGSWFGLIPVCFLIVVIALRAIDEEDDLRKNLIGYEEYCKKVWYRMVPGIF